MPNWAKSCCRAQMQNAEADTEEEVSAEECNEEESVFI
jgi:hypothetical protein